MTGSIQWHYRNRPMMDCVSPPGKKQARKRFEMKSLITSSCSFWSPASSIHKSTRQIALRSKLGLNLSPFRTPLSRLSCYSSSSNRRNVPRLDYTKSFERALGAQDPEGSREKSKENYQVEEHLVVKASLDDTLWWTKLRDEGGARL